MNTYLAINPAIHPLSIALATDTHEIATMYLNNTNGIHEDFIDVIESFCKSHQIEISTLSKILLINGPGPYTTLRIAVSVIKSIAQIHKIPVQTLHSLDAQIQDHSQADGIYLNVMPARNNECNLALYSIKQREIKRLTDDFQLSHDQFLNKLSQFNEQIFVIGGLAETLKTKVQALNTTHIQIAEKPINLQTLIQANTNPGEYTPFKKIIPHYSHKPLV